MRVACSAAYRMTAAQSFLSAIPASASAAVLYTNARVAEVTVYMSAILPWMSCMHAQSTLLHATNAPTSCCWMKHLTSLVWASCQACQSRLITGKDHNVITNSADRAPGS